MEAILLFDFSTWWAEKGTFEQVYWFITVPSTLAFVIILITTFIGGDLEDTGDVDADIDADEGPGFQFFTLKNLVGFFAIFSWIGLACIDAELSPVLTIVISFISGLLMMVIMAATFYFISKLADDGTLKMSSAVGRTGEVYLPIQATRGNIGKVNITVQGSLRTLQAMTDDGNDLPVGAVVQVKEIIDDHILLVTKNT